MIQETSLCASESCNEEPGARPRKSEIRATEDAAHSGASVMTLPREPRIHPVSIAALRPTQITVGMREVKAKRKSWRDHPDRKKADFLGKHLIPVIWGPKEQYYVIDHHHLALALHQEGVKNIATTVVADLRRLPRDLFWVVLDHRAWPPPSDE